MGKFFARVYNWLISKDRLENNTECLWYDSMNEEEILIIRQRVKELLIKVFK